MTQAIYFLSEPLITLINCVLKQNATKPSKKNGHDQLGAVVE